MFARVTQVTLNMWLWPSAVMGSIGVTSGRPKIYMLGAEGRPALTINTILPTINSVLGEQSARADVRFKPRRNTEDEVADTLTKLYMQISDNNRLDWLEQQVFSDGLILDGRGYFDVRIDFSDSLEGEVRVTAKDPLDILLDPDAKEMDPETWNEVFETKWLTIDEVEEVYGKKKAEELRFLAENGNHLGRDSIEFHESTFGDNSVGDEFINSNVPSEGEYKNIKSLRLSVSTAAGKVDEYVDQIPVTAPCAENWSVQGQKFARSTTCIISKMCAKYGGPLPVTISCCMMIGRRTARLHAVLRVLPTRQRLAGETCCRRRNNKIASQSCISLIPLLIVVGW